MQPVLSGLILYKEIKQYTDKENGMNKKQIGIGTLLIPLLIFVVQSKANVLIGIRGIDGGIYDGWRVYNFDGNMVPDSEVQVTWPAVAWNSRYLAGYSIKPGSGFFTVTALCTRDDLSNQFHFLIKMDISNGTVLSSVQGDKNSFNSFFGTWAHYDATYLDDVDGVPVWGYAVTKKEPYERGNIAWGVLMDGNIGDAMEFGPYYETDPNVTRPWFGLAYDPDTQLAYVSTTPYEDEYGRDTIQIYSVESEHLWTFLGEVYVPAEWTAATDIVAMSVGGDYNDDGDKELYVAVQNRTDPNSVGYAEGKDFWTVLDVDFNGDEWILTQLSDPFLVDLPNGGDIFGIALDANMPTGLAPLCGSAGTVYLSGDVNRDCYVNLKDYVLIAEQWLLCTDPALPECDVNWKH